MPEIVVVAGDAILEMQKLQPASVDLVIADPPYNLGKNYGNNHDAKEFEEYLVFSRRWLTEARRVLTPTGTIYVFMGFRFISYIYDILDRELKMFFTNWIVWHYTQGIGRKKGFSPRHDDILMFTKSPKYKFNLDAVRVPQKYFRDRNNMRGANPGDVWEFSHVHYCNENRQEHPTQKPEGLIERLILASSDQDNLVLDPFSGSGTTLRVCQQLGRRAMGFEINPDFVQMTRERLRSKFTGFDSVDPRMARVPLDLRREEVRKIYLENHKKWFLQNHQNALKTFQDRVAAMYGHCKRGPKQLTLFGDEDDSAV
jgi:DNA modification methylase